MLMEKGRSNERGHEFTGLLLNEAGIFWLATAQAGNFGSVP